MKKVLITVVCILLLSQIFAIPTIILAKNSYDKKENDNQYSIGDVISSEQLDAASVNSTIQIDGDYSDWSYIPHTIISWYAKDPNQRHNGALFRDGDTLYCHFKMNDVMKAPLVVCYMVLEINGQTKVPITINTQTPEHKIKETITWGFPAGHTRGLGVFFNEYPKDYIGGDAVVTIYDNNHSVGDEGEFSIDLHELSKRCGIPVDNMREFTIYNPNIGIEGVTSAGTSTGAVVSLSIMTSIALGSVLYFKKKKRVEKVI